MIEIYTDGGCHNNPGRGAWAYLIVENHQIIHKNSGFKELTTNNQMELQAPIEALNSFKNSVVATLYTDSMYVKNGISLWIKNWKLNGWKSSTGAVKNQELWRQLDTANNFHNITWIWVKGHANNKFNNIVDSLVQETIKMSLNT